MNSIPEFPQFKKLELSDEIEIKGIIKKCKFPPYADYNFINIWAWDIHEGMMISKHNGNLVVLFNDYVSNEHFLSFIGINKIEETAQKLIEFSLLNYNSGILKLIPEEIANVLLDAGFKINLDRDSCDYIYQISDLANMNNWSGKDNHSKNISKFIKKFPNYRIEHSSSKAIPKDQYMKMFEEWSKNKKIKDHFEFNEYRATERFFNIGDPNARAISLYVDDNLIGFTIYEILSEEYAVAHFSKGNTKYHTGIYDVLIWEEAKILNTEGIKYYNFEQDLGIPGLRFSKESYKPIFFLKKFFISN